MENLNGFYFNGGSKNRILLETLNDHNLKFIYFKFLESHKNVNFRKSILCV